MIRKSFQKQALIIIAITFLMATSCKQDKGSEGNPQSAQAKLEKLKLAEGFEPSTFTAHRQMSKGHGYR